MYWSILLSPPQAADIKTSQEISLIYPYCMRQGVGADRQNHMRWVQGSKFKIPGWLHEPRWSQSDSERYHVVKKIVTARIQNHLLSSILQFSFLRCRSWQTRWGAMNRLSRIPVTHWRCMRRWRLLKVLASDNFSMFAF